MENGAAADTPGPVRAEVPRNLRGLVQLKDVAEFLGVLEATLRVWRKRRRAWIAQGRKPSSAIYTLLPDPVRDPANPDVAFLFNGSVAYDVEDVKRLRVALEARDHHAGPPRRSTQAKDHDLA